MMPRGSRRTRTAPIACAIGFQASGLKASRSDLPNAGISKIIVRQIRPGLRVRAAFIVEECEPDAIGVLRAMLDAAEHAETVAHALFDSTQNNSRRVDFHELLAMIKQYEAAAARAVS